MLTKATVKLIQSLQTHKGRRKEGLFVAEGPRLVGELLGHFKCNLLLATDAWKGGDVHVEVPLIPVTSDELQRASLLQTPQQVLALFHIPRYTTDFQESCSHRLCLALDDVQDPGNLGTIVRLADWFGIEDIWCTTATADVWSPKAVQACMGGLSRVRVHYINSLPQLLSSLPSDVPVYSTSLQGSSLWQSSLSTHGVIVMGNEGRGVSAEVDACCRQRLLIPNYPEGRQTTESLNVAMATGIVLAEFRRQAAIR